MAPGELVRTTGFIGSEEVVSGTSLAAPQVAAAASLIMEKNLNASPEFVRGLLNETANLYGESDAYGSGLLDAEYALAQYDNYSKNYTKINTQNGVEVKANKRKVETFEDTGCVEGSWLGNDHKNMIAAGYFNVRYGARFPDTKEYMTEDKKYVFRGMEINPWWHGFLRTNYIKAAIYATRVGDAVAKLPVGQLCTADNDYYSQADEMIADLKQINWTTELARMKSENTSNEKAQKQKNTAGFHRAVIWGMAIHSATDIYAHSVRYNSEYLRHVKGDNGINIADDPYTCHWRYEDAQQVAGKIMSKYMKSYNGIIN